MKFFHHLLKINILLCFILLISTSNVFAQNEKQQLSLANSLVKNREYEAALKIFKNLENKNQLRINARDGIRICLKELRQYEELVIYLEK